MKSAFSVEKLARALDESTDRYPAHETGLFPKEEPKPPIYNTIRDLFVFPIVLIIGFYIVAIIACISFILHVADEVEIGFSKPTKRIRPCAKQFLTRAGDLSLDHY